MTNRVFLIIQDISLLVVRLSIDYNKVNFAKIESVFIQIAFNNIEPHQRGFEVRFVEL